MKMSRLVLRFATCCSSQCTWGQREHGAPPLPPRQLAAMPAAPRAPCPRASSLPRGSPWGTCSQPCASRASDPAGVTAAPRLSLPASRPSRARAPHDRLRSSGAGRSERRALLSSRVTRACQPPRHAARPTALPACQAPGAEPGAGDHGSPTVLGSGPANATLCTLPGVRGWTALQGAEAALCPGITAALRTVTLAPLTPCPRQPRAGLPPGSAMASMPGDGSRQLSPVLCPVLAHMPV